MEQKAKYLKIIENIDADKCDLVVRLIDEIVFLEDRMTELKKLPFISVSPKNPALQKQTAAAKQYKECSQSYMNGIRILISVVSKADTNAADELMKKLEEFA